MAKNDTKRQVQEKQYVTEIDVYHTNGSRRKNRKMIKTIQIEGDSRHIEERVPGVSTLEDSWCKGQQDLEHQGRKKQ